MTEQTPATEAGRRLADAISDYLRGAEVEYILAIEAEARALVEDEFWGPQNPDYYRAQGRADALREASERVRALDLNTYDAYIAVTDVVDRVLAILDPETTP